MIPSEIANKIQTIVEHPMRVEGRGNPRTFLILQLKDPELEACEDTNENMMTYLAYPPLAKKN